MNANSSPASTGSLAELLLENMSPRDLLKILARTGGRGRQDFIEVLYSDLGDCIRDLEEQAHRYHEDEEEKLTNYIAVQLRRLSYHAVCEPDNRGHVDLNISCATCNLNWKAEAKIHRDYDTNHEGLRQLLDRYSSGRDKEAGFLLYLRVQNAALIVGRWRAKIMEESLCEAVRCEDDTRGGQGFISWHRHSSGNDICITHFPILLYYAPTDQSHEKTKAPSKARATANGRI